MKYAGLLLIILFLNLFNGLAQFSSEAYKHSGLAVSVMDVSNGALIVSENSDMALVPASTLKLVTTATALEILGSDYTFTTKLAYKGLISGSTLHGNIIINGGGDPTLGSRYFNDDIYGFITSWVEAIKQKGMTTIQGDIVVDASFFYSEPLPTRWVWEDVGNYYGAGVYALSCFDNYYTLHFNAAKIGQLARISSFEPNIQDLEFDVEAYGSNNSSDSAYIFGGPNALHKIVRGSIPANRIDFAIKGAIPNPPLVAAQMLVKALHHNGILVKGDARVVYKKEVIDGMLCTTVSPTLEAIIKCVNFNSNNLFAEHLLRALDPKGDNPSAINKLKSYWSGQGINTSACFLFDGSGLSPSNGLSTRFICDVLSFMQTRSTNKDVFINSIPKAGKEGTVKNFMRNTNDAMLWIKSGSMDNARCYAGYIKKGERMFAFSVMVNKFTCSQKEAVDDIEDYLKSVLDKL